MLRVGGWPVVLMLWYFSGLTFGAVQIGAAVMLKGNEQDPRAGRRMRLPRFGAFVQARAEARIRR